MTKIKENIYWLLVLLVGVCSLPALAKTYRVNEKNFEESMQEGIALAKAEDIIVLPEGRFYLQREIAFSVQGVSLVGSGQNKTVLDFSKQKQGAQGILIAANNIKIKDISVVGTKGDGIVSRGVKGVHIDSVNVSWSDKKSMQNGGYGIYPVLSRNIIIENSTVVGAIEAGIYVGQSESATIRDNTLMHNTSGIDVENSTKVNIYNNKIKYNAIGIVVAKRPGLLSKGSHSISIYDNTIEKNTTKNRAPSHSLLSSLSHGVGVSVVASSNIQIKNNTIGRHALSRIFVSSYSTIIAEAVRDPLFDPYSSTVNIVDNQWLKPRSKRKQTYHKRDQWASLRKKDIVWDGVKKVNIRRVVPTVCVSKGTLLRLAVLTESGKRVKDKIEACNL